MIGLLLLLAGSAFAGSSGISDNVATAQISTANVTVAGFTKMINAQGANQKIKVLAFVVNCSTGALGAQFAFYNTSQIPANIASSSFTTSSSGNAIIAPYNPYGWFTGAANVTLGINMAAATALQACNVMLNWTLAQ